MASFENSAPLSPVVFIQGKAILVCTTMKTFISAYQLITPVSPVVSNPRSSLAVEFALETSNLSDTSLRIERTTPLSTQNPYILPFALRGLLEEDCVRRELHGEMVDLLRQFDDWKPMTKALKDVKFRLEGIRSKL
jgi:hypothetical protein